MKGTRASPVIRWRRSAIMSAWRSSSMAHGPAISASGAPPPIVIPPATCTGRVRGSPIMPSLGSCRPLVIHGGADEGREQRVRRPRLGAKLRMELPRDEPRVARQLDDLDELLLGPDARDLEPARLERLEVVGLQ